MARILTVFAGAVCLFSALVGPGRAGEERKPAKEAFDDAAFVQKAASGGLHEVALGRIAASKAKSEGVKAFGELMIADHGKAGEALKKAANSAGINVPETMNEQHQKEVARFKDYMGSDFDRDYIKHMISDHEKDLALFTRASKEATNPTIKDFAANTLPTVQAHLEAAKKLLPIN